MSTHLTIKNENRPNSRTATPKKVVFSLVIVAGDVCSMTKWLPNLVRRTTEASLTWWWPSLRSKVIRGQMWWTTCYGYQTWSEESLIQVYDDDLHGGQRSSEVKCDKLCSMATKLGQKNPWFKLMMMMTFMEIKGHQRSKVLNYALWLPNLVRRIPNASLNWWWPSWRSKVRWGQI